MGVACCSCAAFPLGGAAGRVILASSSRCASWCHERSNSSHNSLPLHKLQRLGELAVSSAPGARPAGLEALKRTLADRAVFYRCGLNGQCLGYHVSRLERLGVQVRCLFVSSRAPASSAPKRRPLHGWPCRSDICCAPCNLVCITASLQGAVRCGAGAGGAARRPGAGGRCAAGAGWDIGCFPGWTLWAVLGELQRSFPAEFSCSGLVGSWRFTATHPSPYPPSHTPSRLARPAGVLPPQLLPAHH